jgi:NAD(P)-dependent dehydrogenase (short-subunit alcohol dehydrogenase family)
MTNSRIRRGRIRVGLLSCTCSAFRAGVAGLAKSLSFELASDGFLVNTLGPGRISTERSVGFDAAQAERMGVSVEEVRCVAEAQIPLGRYGTPEEFARVAVFTADLESQTSPKTPKICNPSSVGVTSSFNMR